MDTLNNFVSKWLDSGFEGAGYKVTYDEQEVRVHYKQKLVLSGGCNMSTGLRRLPLAEDNTTLCQENTCVRDTYLVIPPSQLRQPPISPIHQLICTRAFTTCQSYH